MGPRFACITVGLHRRTPIPATYATWTVSWDAPSDAGSASLTGYKIYKSTDELTWTLAGTVASGVLSYQLTGLTSGTWYARVSSVNANGESAAGASISTTL